MLDFLLQLLGLQSLDRILRVFSKTIDALDKFEEKTFAKQLNHGSKIANLEAERIQMVRDRDKAAKVRAKIAELLK